MPKPPVIFLGFANDRVDHARYLRNLPKELDGIRKALYLAEQMGLCEIVERANLTVDHIISVFQDPRYRDRIAIFHYGGHAHGYQLLLETLDDKNLVGESEGLVPFFAKQKSLQLVFLNGCASRPHALELVAAGIPAVVGTAEPINDHVATQLSVRFYKGLGNGLPLDRAWAEAEDEVKMSTRKGSYRDLVFDVEQWEKTGEVNALPWELHLREGAEQVQEWSLPQACGNPLFGLPDLPTDIELPEEPFLFFKRYERKDAAVFFGRSAYIRDLYNRVTDPESPPLVLLYGQSGVGKSSLFDAGLRPRLEHAHEVVYIRRQPDSGLVGTLTMALDDAMAEIANQTYSEEAEADSGQSSISPTLKQLLDSLNQSVQEFEEQADPQQKPLLDQLKAMQAHGAGIVQDLEQSGISKQQARQARLQKARLIGDGDHLLSRWLQVEAQLDQPLVILLDQVEEVFTRPSKDVEELNRFLTHLEQIFGNPDLRPEGRLILAYRKEYHPEIEKGCKAHALPRAQIFLERLKREEMVEVVEGLTSTDRLRNRYHLSVEELLAGEIADDLLADRDSPVAPILQILITKMWNHAIEENSARPEFTIDLYRDLKDEGILLDEFFSQQIEKVEAQMPASVESGLLLDLLNYHTTPLGTADSRSVDSIRQFYNHREEEIEALLQKCNDLYLLADAGSKLSLSHDTLAPLVQRAFRESDAPGQRATRILDNKLLDFDEKNPATTLDPMDLELVEKGENGMRHWGPREQELVRLSRIRRDREKRNRTLLWAAFVIGMLAIGGLGVFSFFQKREAVKQQGIAERNEMIADSQRFLADSNRQVAEFNEQLADSNRQVAEFNEYLADSAKDEAIYQEQIARSEALVNEARLLLRDNDPRALAIAKQARKTFRSDRTFEMLLRTYHHSPIPSSVYASEHAPIAFQVDEEGGKQFVAVSEGTKNHLIYELSPSGQVLQRLKGHANPINHLSTTDRHIASVAEDKALLIWARNASSEPKRVELDNYGAGKFVQFLPGGDRLMVLSGQNWMIFSTQGKLLTQFDTLSSAPTAMAMAPSGDVVALAYQTGKVELRRLTDGEIHDPSRPLQDFDNRVSSLAFSSDGSRLISVSEDRVRVQRRDGSQAKDWQTEQQMVETAAFFDKDRYIITGGANKDIRIWDSSTGLFILSLKGHNEAITGLQIPSNDRGFYSSSKDGTIRYWPLDGRHRQTFASAKGIGADWGKNGSLIVGTDSDIGIWKGGYSYQRLKNFEGDRGLAVMGVSADGRRILAISKKRNFFLWNQLDQAPKELSAGSERVNRTYSVRFSRRWIAVGANPKARLFKADGSFYHAFAHEERKVDVVAIHPNERSLLTVSANSLKVWDIGSKQLRHELPHNMTIRDAVFLPGNQGVLLAGENDIYRYQPGASKLTPMNMPHDPRSLDLSSDRRYLVSASGNGWILWDVARKKKLYQHAANDAQVMKVAFSPDGSEVVTVSDDGTVRRWLIDEGGMR